MHYNYCPTCGEKLIPKEAGDDGNIPYCEKCQKYWFDGFASCVIVLVHNEFDEIALGRQSYLSDKYCTFTSGYITPGENAEETAIREVKEELGLSVRKLEYAGTYWFAKREQLMHGFIAEVKKQNFTLSVEVDSAEWVPALEAPKLMFPPRPGNAMHEIYQQYMKSRS